MAELGLASFPPTNDTAAGRSAMELTIEVSGAGETAGLASDACCQLLAYLPGCPWTARMASHHEKEHHLYHIGLDSYCVEHPRRSR